MFPSGIIYHPCRNQIVSLPCVQMIPSSAHVHGLEVPNQFLSLGQPSPGSEKIRTQYKQWQAQPGWNNCGAHCDLLFLDTPGNMAMSALDGPNFVWL